VQCGAIERQALLGCRQVRRMLWSFLDGEVDPLEGYAEMARTIATNPVVHLVGTELALPAAPALTDRRTDQQGAAHDPSTVG
jgi:hypothetical protein